MLDTVSYTKKPLTDGLSYNNSLYFDLSDQADENRTDYKVQFNIKGITLADKGYDEDYWINYNGAYWDDFSKFIIKTNHADGSADYKPVIGSGIEWQFTADDQTFLPEDCLVIDNKYGYLSLQLPYTPGDTFEILTPSWSQYPDDPFISVTAELTGSVPANYSESKTVSGEEYPGQWGGMAFSNESLEYIIPEDGMKVTVNYSVTDDAEDYRSIVFIDQHNWFHMNEPGWDNAISGIENIGNRGYYDMLESDHPIQLDDGWIYIPGDGQMTFYVTEQGVRYLLSNAEEYPNDDGSKWFGIGFQVNGVNIDSVTYEWNVRTVTDRSGFVYLPNDDGTCRITGYAKKTTENSNITIPEKIGDLTVTGIDRGVFCGRSINGLQINAHLDPVTSDIFYGLSVKKVRFADTSTIEEYAITDPALTEIYVPESVTSIARFAFGFYYEMDEDTCKMVRRKNEDLTIYCNKDSLAHKYAERFGFKYVLLDEQVKANPAVSFQKGDGAVKLSWNKVEGAEKYAIAGLSGGKWKILAEGPSTASSYILKDLKPGVEYTVAIVAMFDGEWNMNFDTAITVTPNAAPNNYPVVTAAVKGSQFKLDWTAADNAEAYCVAVYRNGKWTVIKNNISPGTLSFISPSGNTPSGTYKVAVAAKINGKWDTTNISGRAVTVTVG